MKPIRVDTPRFGVPYKTDPLFTRTLDSGADDNTSTSTANGTGLGSRIAGHLVFQRPTLPTEETSDTCLIGDSKALKDIRTLILKVARTKAEVLITGETGTGKELVAKEIFTNSNRKEKPFIVVNCAAIPKGLIESTLFGHESGAFTDAKNRTPGIFDSANGGTVFLDEIGELDKNLQLKLTRVIEYGTFQRVGGTEEVKTDVRVISATNRNIQSAVAKGEFSRGLYDLLNTFHIHIPPLRERPEDITPIAFNILEKNKNFSPDKIVSEISTEALDMLSRNQWTGNVRQLENVIKRAVIFSNGGVIKKEDLAFDENEASLKVLEHFEDVAFSNATVLITGEAGAGKEHFSRKIHALSNKADKPLIVLNCSSLPEGVAESELFGHKKGSFTGANRDHIGYFENANGKTLLLDEVGELPLNIQAKLLRAIQQGEITVMGTNTPKKVNVRIIATSNHDLEKDVKEGKFREDLLHRLSVIPLKIPPLRERKNEISDIANRFLNDLKGGSNIKGFSTEAIVKLVNYDWPGNIRELKSIIKRAIILSGEENEISAENILIEDAPQQKSSLHTKYLNMLNNLLLFDDLREEDQRIKLLVLKCRTIKAIVRYGATHTGLKQRVADEMCTENSLFNHWLEIEGYSNMQAFINALSGEIASGELERQHEEVILNPVLNKYIKEMDEYIINSSPINFDHLKFLAVKCRILKMLINSDVPHESNHNIAKYIKLPESTIRRWVKEKNLTVHDLIQNLKEELLRAKDASFC